MSHPWIEDSKLWLVLDRSAAFPRELSEVTEQAIAGGVSAVLCRIKDAPLVEIKPVAGAIREICRRLHTAFVMSHHPDLALELQADAVQLGTEDQSIADVRNIVGGSIAIGYSTHGVGEAAQRFKEGADYVFLGPVFATPEKLKYGDPLGLDVVSDAAVLPGPVVFIGGINEGNLSQVIARGGKRVAAISALQRVDDPQAATERMLAMLDAAR
jgi:thiamine-phosphate pyrophosphorylase